MCTKGFKVTVELDLHAVTCPGVWLCPSGKVFVKMKVLGFSAKTKCLPPLFPLLFHEKFVFEKLVSTCQRLSELHRCFEKETVFAELLQKTGADFTDDIILAAFKISLTDLLYPCTSRRGVLAGVDIDLLMEPSCHFPGIIAPKVEISTKTVVEEVNLKLSDRRKASVNPKTLRSKTTSEHIEPKEKAKLARLRGHPGSCCYVHPVSHQCARKANRPPFIVPQKDDEYIARVPNAHKSIPPLPALPCHRWAGKKQHCRMFSDANNSKMLRGKSLDRLDSMEERSPFKECFEYPEIHRGDCNICKLYKCYFPRHITEKKDVSESGISAGKNEEIESNEIHEEIDNFRPNSSSKDSLLKGCTRNNCEANSQVKYFSDYGSCNRMTDAVSKKVKDALCRVDYPYFNVGGKCCNLCKHSRISLMSTMPFKDSESCVSSQRPKFYKNLEQFFNRFYKQVKSQTGASI